MFVNFTQTLTRKLQRERVSGRVAKAALANKIEDISAKINHNIFFMIFGISLLVTVKHSRQPSQTRRWSRRKPNCYGGRQDKTEQNRKNRVKIGAYLNPVGLSSRPI